MDYDYNRLLRAIHYGPMTQRRNTEHTKRLEAKMDKLAPLIAEEKREIIKYKGHVSRYKDIDKKIKDYEAREKKGTGFTVSDANHLHKLRQQKGIQETYIAYLHSHKEKLAELEAEVKRYDALTKEEMDEIKKELAAKSGDDVKNLEHPDRYLLEKK